MISSLLNNEKHRIEYLNFKMAGNPCAFALYIRAEIDSSRPYSMEAKHRLFMCLDHINRCLEKEKLVAIYFDIHDNRVNRYSAFDQMMQDANAALFSLILVCDLNELLHDAYLNGQMHAWMNRLNSLEYFDLADNVMQSRLIPLNQLLGV